MKYLLFFLAGTLLPFNLGYAQEDALGFLGLTFAPAFENGSSQNFKLPLMLEGGAENHDLTTGITFFSDLTRLSNQFNNNSDFLQSPEQYLFSYISLHNDYTVMNWSLLHLTSGFELGHRGFLNSVDNDLKYSLYAAFRLGLRWFFAAKWRFRVNFQLPLSLYSHNIRNLFFYQAMTELTFDPVGPILNPQPGTALYSIGVQYESFSYSNQSVGFSGFFYAPYLKISLLY